MDEDILFSRLGGLGKVVLNRPKALNALSLEMCHALEAQLREWAEDHTVKAVLIRGAGDRAFCSGGDVRKLYDTGKTGEDYPFHFWADEYRLNALIKHYRKPYIALIDGIVMGGGVGVSVHGSHRVVSEHALFAMPETGLGLFPDVGASYFLSRCPGLIGLYFGLTGARIKAADLAYAGLATHYVPRGELDALEAALAEEPGNIHSVLAGFAKDPGPPPLAAHRNEIDLLFAGRSLKDVIDAIAAAKTEFSQTTAATLATKSPTSMSIAFRAYREGAQIGFDDCMRMEWRIASTVPRNLGDFFEGVRAIIIDKDNKPNWTPARLADIDPKTIDGFFAPSAHGELKLH